MPSPGPTTKVVAIRIRRLRDKRGWSARRLAEECARLEMPSLTREIIAKIESGRRDVNVDEVDVLAAALEVTVQQLMANPTITLLHLSDLQFGPESAFGLSSSARPTDALAAICRDLEKLDRSLDVRPDLIVLTGDLGVSGRHREFDLVTEFLQGLARHTGLDFTKIAIIPGDHDVNVDACRAYLADCDANDQEPAKPYWANWRHFAKLFQSWPDDGFAIMQAEQPWSLFEMRDLRVVVAGFNSTIEADTRDPGPGTVGVEQLEWFKHQLKQYEDEGWLRIGAVHHNPLGEAGTGMENLGDAALLDREIGAHLNLLLHGHGGSAPEDVGSSGTRLASGVLVLGAGSRPAARPDPAHANLYQVLRITPDGVDRLVRRLDLSGAGADAVAVIEDGDGWSWVADGPWSGAHATFPVSSTRSLPARKDDDWESPAGAWAARDRQIDRFRPLDPRRELLDRVAGVFEIRHPGAIVQRVSGSPPLLRVTYKDGGDTRQQRITASVGSVKEEDVDRFVGRIHGAAGDDDAELVVDAVEPPKSLRDYARRRGVVLRTFREYQILIDLSSHTAAQLVRMANDPRYLPSSYVPQRYRDTTDAYATTADLREDVVGEMLRLLVADEGRFILLLGDFGRGKTFALRELTRRISTEVPDLTPVLIDLRALDKANTVEGHLSAHLANNGYEGQFGRRGLQYLLNTGRLVLIFDGFDELVARATYDRAAEHLHTLLAAAQHRAKIVVASRTQHFVTTDQVRTAMGARVDLFPQRRVVTLAEMSPEQVRVLLVHHLGSDDRATRHLALLEQLAGLAELARNPRLLGFIAHLDEARLRSVVDARGAISPAGLYQQILDAWLTHEHNRTQGVVGAPAGLTLEDLWRAVTVLAVRIWESDEVHINIQTLGDVATMLTQLASGHLTKDQIVHAVGAGTLLVRDEDTNYFSFIHESVVEWLVARRIAHDLTTATPPQSPLLEHRALSSLTVDFLTGLAPAEVCRSWASATLARGDADSSSRRTNASRIVARLSSAPGLDLRAISLRGEELSNRVWPAANLEGADLTQARLSSVDFSRANLRGANLEYAVLESADLSAADLTGANLRHAQLTRTKLARATLEGADLTDARLMDVDLTDTKIAGSVWRRTAVVAATADKKMLTTARSLGATILPGGDPLTVAYRPVRVGVKFGFDEGQLPRPLAYDSEGTLLAVGNEDGSVLVVDAEDGRFLRVLTGHTERAYAVIFHPHQPLLATGARDGTARLWDATRGQRLHLLPDHPGWVWPLLFNADGTRLATGANDGTVRVWDTATGTVAVECQGHKPPVWTVAFDPSGSLLATGDNGGTPKLFSLTDGRLLHRLEARGATVFRLRFPRQATADGQLLLIGGCGDGVVRVWDARDGRLVQELVGHTNAVYALDFHPDGHYIVSADTDGRVFQWPLDGDGASVDRVELAPHSGAVYRVTFSPKGKLFATGDNLGAIRLWDAQSCEPTHELPPHRASVWPMVFRPDGERLATCSNDFTVNMWNSRTGGLVGSLTGTERWANMVSFSADGSLLATSDSDGKVRLWDPRTGELISRLPSQHWLDSAVFGPDPALLVTAASNGRVLIWAGEATDEGMRFTSGRIVDLPTDNVWATTFAPDGDRLAVANDDGTVEVLYFKTSRSILRLPGDGRRVRAMAFSPDGTRLATGGDGSGVLLRNPETGQVLAELAHHKDRIFSLTYTTDGSKLATASHDGTAAIWDAMTLKPIRVIEPTRDRLWSVAFHPGGRMLATAGDNRVIDIWDVETGKRLHQLGGHTRRVLSVAFSKSGDVLASCSRDGSVRLWCVAENQISHAATLLGLNDGWVAFTPSGRYKASGDTRGAFWHTAGMIRFEPGELARFVPDTHELPRRAALY